MALLYPRSHPQWRAEGISIGGSYRRGMGIACQRNHFKRVYFPDNLAAIASNDKMCIFLITWLLLPRMIKAFTSKDGWLIGISWALLTIAFEFAAGLAGGSIVSELLAAYNLLSGNLWLLVLATTLLSPIIVKHIHNTIK